MGRILAPSPMTYHSSPSPSAVPKGRFELPRGYPHYALNVARLPVPPLRLVVGPLSGPEPTSGLEPEPCCLRSNRERFRAVHREQLCHDRADFAPRTSPSRCRWSSAMLTPWRRRRGRSTRIVGGCSWRRRNRRLFAFVRELAGELFENRTDRARKRLGAVGPEYES
jgi:hypothetical protein